MMLRMEEFQVRARGEALPERGLEECAAKIACRECATEAETAGVLRDILVYVAKAAEEIGYTMSEICEL